MDKRIGWYLVELERRLKRGLPADRASKISAELQNHLQEDVDWQVRAGAKECDAAKVALTRIGHPELIARNYLQAGVGLRMRGIWEWTVFVSALLTGVLGVSFVPLSMTINDADTWILTASGVFVLLFCIATFAVRRLMIQHLLLLFVLILLASTLTWPRLIIGPVYEDTLFFSRSEATDQSNRLGKELQAYRKFLDGSREAYAAVLSGRPLTFYSGTRNDGGFLAPKSIWARYQTLPNEGFTHVKREQDARFAWLNLGRHTVAVLEGEVFVRERKLAGIDRWLNATPWSAYFDSLKWTAPPSAWWLLILSVAHCLFFALGRVVSAIRQARRELA